MPVETVLQAPKTTILTRFKWQGIEGQGYEIHMGQTHRHAGQGLLEILAQNGRPCFFEDGCAANDLRVIGTYMHGFFDSPNITAHWLKTIGHEKLPMSPLHGPRRRDRAYDQLADHLSAHVNLDSLMDRIRAYHLRKAPSGMAALRSRRTH